MISLAQARRIALAFPDTVEQDHFGRPSFRVHKKIFATLHPATQRMVLKLSLVDQSAFSAFDKSIIFPVPGGWGKQGWTVVELTKVRTPVFKDAIATAYRIVSSKRKPTAGKRTAR